MWGNITGQTQIGASQKVRQVQLGHLDPQRLPKLQPEMNKIRPETNTHGGTSTGSKKPGNNASWTEQSASSCNGPRHEVAQANHTLALLTRRHLLPTSDAQMYKASTQ